MNIDKKLDENEMQPVEKKKKINSSTFSCPPITPISTIIALIILLFFIYGTLWGLMEEAALPRGPVFGLFFLVISCYLGGQFFRLFKIPSLVGMMVCGFMLRNTPHIDIANDIPEEWASNIRNFALTLILLRAGLEVDCDVLKNNKITGATLIFIPFFVEVISGAVVSFFLLKLPWLYSFLTGFMLAAVSPAVVLPVVLKLQEKGIGVTSGIPTLVIAVAGFDDVLAITGFKIILGITFSTDNLGWNIGKGAIQILAGFLYGILLGLISWYIPNPSEADKSVLRIAILLFGGTFVMFGTQPLDLGGAGALGCICLPFVAAIRWKKKDWDEHDNPINNTLAFIWRIFEPFLFGLVGSEIRLDEFTPNAIGLAFAILFIGLAFKMVAAVLSAYCLGLTFKEQIFVMLAGLPKATVQAAIGPVTLSYVKKLHLGPQYEQYGIQIVTIAVLSILITAPVGATAISLLAPRLLDDKKGEEKDNEDTLSMKANLGEKRRSVFNLDPNVYTATRL